MQRLIGRVVAMTTLVVLTTTTARAQAPDSLPNGVTAAMISDGGALFKAQGLCFACHGQQGEGIPNLGANLRDQEWVHSDGSYEGILETVLKGAQAQTGAVMPPNGGATLTDAQSKAIAAYVWSLSQKGGG